MMRAVLVAVGGAALLTVAVAAASPPVESPPTAATPSTGAGTGAGAGTVLMTAGDVAQCNEQGDDATAALIEPVLAAHPDASVLMLGDGAYPEGSKANYDNCYGPTWGRFKDRTHPATGNHEYEGQGQELAGPYFDFWGAAAGQRPYGNYSFDLGGWHIIVLNSTCGKDSGQDGCTAGDSMGRWLEGDLEANRGKDCIAAAWHHAFFNSSTVREGDHEKHPPVLPNDDVKLAGIWQILERYNVDVAFTAHRHVYERFAPQVLVSTSSGQNEATVDQEKGIREFVVGTGGGEHEEFVKDASGQVRPDRVAANSEARFDLNWGVLEMTLGQAGYSWRFLSAGTPGTSEPAAGTVLDSGTGSCRPGSAASSSTSTSSTTSGSTSTTSVAPEPVTTTAGAQVMGR